MHHDHYLGEVVVCPPGWTPEQQEQLVRAVEMIEEQESDLRLDEDEVAGVRQAPGA